MLIIRLSALLTTCALMAAPTTAATNAEAEAVCQAVLATPGTGASLLALKGDCALAFGDYQAAVGHYRAALLIEPGNVRVRADLSSVLLLTSRFEEAKPVLRAATQSNPDDPEALAMADLGAQIAAGSYRPPAPQDGPRGSVSLARVYDSNVNSGPTSATFDAIIGGTLLKLNVADDAKGKPGWATEVAGAANYMHRLDAANAVVLSGDATLTIYDAQSAFSRLDVSVGAGLVRNERDLTWSVTPNMRLIWRDTGLAEAGMFVDGRVQKVLNQQLALVGFGKLGYTHVPTNTAFSTANGLAGAGIEYWLTDSVLLGAHLVAERDLAGLATESHSTLGPRLFVKAEMTDSLTFDLGYAYSYSIYDDTSAVFPLARRDSQHEVSAGLTQDLSFWGDGLSASLRYSYQNLDSTIDFHDRDRHLVKASVKYSF